MSNETWQEREAREKILRANFFATMEKVTGLMGWSFSRLEDYRDACYLIGDEEARIWANLDMWHKNKERINLSGSYPNDYGITYGIKTVKISISVTKEPTQIAKDIENRFLPKYLIGLEKAKEQIRNYDKYETNRKATVQKVADYLGAEIHQNGNIYYPTGIGAVHQIKSHGENEVEFTVECSPEKAIEIFEILKS